MKAVSTVLSVAATLTAAVTIALPSTRAATLPFTEHFAGNVANWADSTGLALLTHVPTGGPDGDSYASTIFVPAGSGDSSVVLFRAQDEFGSSAHAFEGNWLADGVGQFTAYVRHNAPQPLSFFTRFAAAVNYPGAVAVQFAPVLPNTWTLLSFDISPANPAFVSYEGTNFGTVFSNVAHVQIGVSVPAALDSFTSPLTFDLDRPTILPVPEPTGSALALGALFGCFAWRRAVRALD